MSIGDDTLTRGELAKQCGVHFETIRYYEQRGLIPRAARSTGNYRLYPADTVRRLGFVKRAKELGFTLKEIGELLSLGAAPEAKCGKVSERIETKIGGIDEKIRALRSIRKALSKLKGRCQANAPISECPLLGSLHDELA